MTDKRFTIVDTQFISYYGGNGHKISNGECAFWLWHSEKESQKVCDKLNNILDENEQLTEFAQHNYSESKKIISNLQKENEQLKQFKEKVFNLIDKKLEENKELDGVDTAMYYANKQTLIELKKELEE